MSKMLGGRCLVGQGHVSVRAVKVLSLQKLAPGGPGAAEMLLLLDTPCRTTVTGLVKGHPAEVQ